MVDAYDVNGEPVAVQEMIVGTVDEMDYSNGTPQPSVNGSVVDIGSILRLKAAEETNG